MKVIIAGSREITDYDVVLKAIKCSNFKITEVVSGGAVGVDSLGEKYANENNIPIKQFIPLWKAFRQKAGILRNIEMAKYADALIAVWDGKSTGTQHMIMEARKRNLKVYVYIVSETSLDKFIN